MKRARPIVLSLCALVLVFALFAVAAQAKKGNHRSPGKNPSRAFVTGGGWITSPSGAYRVQQRVWDQGFETDTGGWYGSITRVASGADGITSATGGWHALFGGDTESGLFSRFDAYRSVWTGDWVASVKVYLDTGWSPGSGFDYSVAANGADGQHQRDFIFHVTKDSSTGALLVAGSNNTNFAPREDLESINHFEITKSGWYTLRHTFRDNGGVLAVDLQVLGADGTLLFTETRSDAADLISAVGGNRYAWFTCIKGMALAVDDHRLDFPAKADPTGKATFGFVSKYRKKGAGAPTGNTRFKFRAGALKFKSTAYDRLVIDGATAEYTGEGTINGAGEYGFVLTACDGRSSGDDTFRIQIVDKTEHSVIYDSADQPLGGGSIVIHKAK